MSRIAEAKLQFYANTELPEQEEDGAEYDPDLQNALMMRDMAKEILELRRDMERLGYTDGERP